MHSVLIVDDEPFVRLSIASMRAWEEDGYDLTHEASNGKEALDVLAAHPEIDLVLLDISMPVMDGIEFLRHRAGSGAAVIVLSAYDDFHLVRTAFTLGAVDYVRKEEMEGDSLLSAMNKAAAGMEKSRDAGSSVIERRNVDFLRGQMLRDLLAEPMTGDSRPALESLGVVLDAPFFICAFWIADFHDVSARYRSEGLERFASMVERSLAQVLSKRGKGYVVLIRPDHAVVFFHGNEEPAGMYCSDAKEYLERYLSVRVSFSRSASCERLEDARRAYQAVVEHRGVESRIVVLAKRFIRESFADPALSLAGVAARAGVSKNHLSWEFARETGETLTEYIARIRIEEAKRLFAMTRLKVYEVAEKVGFQNVEHFSRLFKKLAGASPSAWPGISADEKAAETPAEARKSEN
ncbi:MAG TPA: helix-turn-helix domain-containing protein [Spirochaetia bacterium]|nr:helix-turn-helix domain-containing protein [Spirochaetia bacterium]